MTFEQIFQEVLDQYIQLNIISAYEQFSATDNEYSGWLVERTSMDKPEDKLFIDTMSYNPVSKGVHVRRFVYRLSDYETDSRCRIGRWCADIILEVDGMADFAESTLLLMPEINFEATEPEVYQVSPLERQLPQTSPSLL